MTGELNASGKMLELTAVTMKWAEDVRCSPAFSVGCVLVKKLWRAG